MDSDGTPGLGLLTKVFRLRCRVSGHGVTHPYYHVCHTNSRPCTGLVLLESGLSDLTPGGSLNVVDVGPRCVYHTGGLETRKCKEGAVDVSPRTRSNVAVVAVEFVEVFCHPQPSVSQEVPTLIPRQRSRDPGRTRLDEMVPRGPPKSDPSGPEGTRLLDVNKIQTWVPFYVATMKSPCSKTGYTETFMDTKSGYYSTNLITTVTGGKRG